MNFSLANQWLLHLFFNQTITCFKRTREAVQEIKTDLQLEESPSFQRIQTIIWKPLVCYYFPRFQRSLNVKNWMHVLRRRIAHLKIHNPRKLPLTKNMSSDLFTEKNDAMIEGCEWIYKCPLSFKNLKGTSDPNIKFCNVCKKKVYNVKTKEELRTHANQGHCIAYNYRDPHLEPVRMGKCLLPPSSTNTGVSLASLLKENKNYV